MHPSEVQKGERLACAKGRSNHRRWQCRSAFHCGCPLLCLQFCRPSLQCNSATASTLVLARSPCRTARRTCLVTCAPISRALHRCPSYPAWLATECRSTYMGPLRLATSNESLGCCCSNAESHSCLRSGTKTCGTCRRLPG